MMQGVFGLRAEDPRKKEKVLNMGGWEIKFIAPGENSFLNVRWGWVESPI